MRTLTKIIEVKSVGTFPTTTVKLATSPLSPQTMLTFQQNESSSAESFFGHTEVLGGRGRWERRGGWRDDPAKADQVVVIMSGQYYEPISWKSFFTVFQVILTFIAEPQSFLFKRPPPLSFIHEDADKKEGLVSQISQIACHVWAMYTTLLDSQRFSKL